MPKAIPMPERFWSRVVKSDGCWEWTGYKDAQGYGWIGKPGRQAGIVAAHRYSAMLHFGMFDRRLLVCHHCDNPACVRPDHIYLGDHLSNSRDMFGRGRNRNGNDAVTACPSGHDYSPENTAIRQRGDGRTYRVCRICERAKSKRNYDKEASHVSASA